MGKGHWFYSVSRFKCPRCHEGDYYPVKNPYNLSRLAELHDECSHCGLKYEVEPGFYLGAMYISYAFGSGSSMITYWILMYFVETSYLNIMFAVLGHLILLAPIYYKVSRIAWINIFVHYNKEYSKNELKP